MINKNLESFKMTITKTFIWEEEAAKYHWLRNQIKWAALKRKSHWVEFDGSSKKEE